MTSSLVILLLMLTCETRQRTIKSEVEEHKSKAMELKPALAVWPADEQFRSKRLC